MTDMDVDTPPHDSGAAAPVVPKPVSKPAPKPAQSGTATGQATCPRIEIKKWNAVALWSWDMESDVCAICRNNNMELCIECQADQDAKVNNNCSIAWGICNHAFHFHCISRWLKNRNSCPLDNREWDYQKYGN
ncbi:RING-box protein hrt1 [Coemansia aciculifera]|uniref:RING-box protein hrt1 n=2 Tax=Coemansia TaxID=4863 RepID=A0A9W8H1W0_9FUNG|nr:RING-box protein hrt1 [Coemansia pectinata]KAJ2862096.1 RING-box protein hrt1 [Coemansia aciculifera]KAJ2871907.1 RING-box protein hrt1 [Coemansia aciculifera]KAJ2883375.1 RING-box protein hrt1 [Coemansia aciculifera]